MGGVLIVEVILMDSLKMRDCPGCGCAKVVMEGSLMGWPLQRCTSCRLVTVSNPPDEAQLQDIYNKVYVRGGLYQSHLKELEEIRALGTSRQGFYRNQVFLKRFRPAKGDRLLEVGCGVGAFLVAARNEGWLAEGVDLSEEALQASASVHGVPVHHGTLDTVNLTHGTYAALVCWEVMEHLVQPGRFLARARTLLLPGGLFICSVPNEGSKVPRYVEKLGAASVPPIHLNFFDCQSLTRLFELNGFIPVSVAPQKSLWSMAGRSDHMVRWFFDQCLALVGMTEGPKLFAVARSKSGDV